MGSMKDLLGDTPFPEQRQAFARTTDLQTSHEAADKVDPIVNKLESIVFEAIRAAGGHGANWNEQAVATGLDKSSISPRWKPLRKKNLITQRVDADGKVVKRNGQTVWVAK